VGLQTLKTTHIADCRGTIFYVVLVFMKQLVSGLGEAVTYVLCGRVDDPIAIDIQEDKEHLT
jgi:hypothetical protein